MFTKFLASIYVALLITPTIVLIGVCGAATVFALLSIPMLPACLAVSFAVTCLLFWLYHGCLRIWINKPSITIVTALDWVASVFGVVVGSLGISFVLSKWSGHWNPDGLFCLAAVCLIVASFLIPFTLLKLSQQTVEVATDREICEDKRRAGKNVSFPSQNRRRPPR